MTEKSITLEDGDESIITFEKRCVYLYVYVCMFWGVRQGGHGKLRTTSLYWCLEEKPY